MRSAAARPHWSYSSVSQYLRCPLQYYFERILGLPRTSATDAQALGSAVHSALAEHHRGLRSGRPMTTRRVHRAYLAAWGELNGRLKVVACRGRSLGDARDLGIALVDLYLREPPPENIVAVAMPLMAPIANSRGEYLEDPILVVPDLIARDGGGRLIVREIKTSGRSFSVAEVATSLQPTFHASAIRETSCEEATLELTALIKTRTPRVQAIRASRTGADSGRLGDLIEAVSRAVKAGIFHSQESPMNCPGCPFFRECRAWPGPGRSNFGHRKPARRLEGVAC